jgi:superfamily II DNA or RNA helicase
MFDPAELRPGARVRLPGHTDPTTVVTVKPGAYWELLVEGVHGDFQRTSLPEAELPGIEVLDRGGERAYDADPRVFRLGVEARRIRTRFQHDMAALAVSNIEPLPHQLEAVYGHFLEQPRLRFLLADDPGAGKTIMAGLYIKELQLRNVADRVLIVAPANLGFQWQRELDERFQIKARRITRDTIDAAPTENPWDSNGVFIVSRDLLKSDEILQVFAGADRAWDLAVLDEAHGYGLKVNRRGAIDNRTARYKAAEVVAERSERLLLLTATPHSGREESIWGLMRLLDPDMYGDRCPEHVDVHPQHYSKTSKEQMVDLRGNLLFKRRTPHTVAYQLQGPEWELYQAVSAFITEGLAEIQGEGRASVSGFALTTMQRRLASSVRAISRTLQRRVERLERELVEPASSAQPTQVASGDRTGNDNGDRTESERWSQEEEALAVIPRSLEEIEAELSAVRPLLVQAQETEALGSEIKLNELWRVLDEYGVGDDASKKLLIFTEHKDTLDFLREKLSERFDVVVIHGGMRPGERIDAERAFREHAQIMVATEAAGEGINLQFCHLMVNYDIPWNPNRLEQRMGRVHRIGQTEDVHIFNLVAENTREGHVLATVLKKLGLMGESLGDRVFDVIGEVLSAYRLPELLQAVVAGERTSQDAAAQFGTEDETYDPELFARAENLLAKALATGHIDWRLQRQLSERAEERRLPPDHLKRFFIDAIDLAGGKVTQRLDKATLRVDRTPDLLIARDRDRGTLRQLRPAYERITFDKSVAVRRMAEDSELGAPRPELCGPGHSLFENLVDYVIEATGPAMQRGAVFYDPDQRGPAVMHVVEADVVDGHRALAHRSFATICEEDGVFRSSGGVLYDLLPGGAMEPGDRPTVRPEGELITWARQNVFETRVKEVRADREHTTRIQEEFLTASFRTILARHDKELLDLDDDVDAGRLGAEGRRRRAELAKRTVQERRDRRLADVARTRQVDRGPVHLLAQCLILPAPAVLLEDSATRLGRGLSDPEIERIAVQLSIDYEHEHGAVGIRSVESEHLGFDLVSEREDERRCIEVKGRSGVGAVELTWSEYVTAVKLGAGYWLYVVLDCATDNPRLYRVQDPAAALAGSFTPNHEVRYSVASGPVIDAAEQEAS